MNPTGGIDKFERPPQIGKTDNQSLSDRIRELEVEQKNYATREWVLTKGYAVIGITATVVAVLLGTLVRAIIALG